MTAQTAPLIQNSNLGELGPWIVTKESYTVIDCEFDGTPGAMGDEQNFGRYIFYKY